MLLSQIKRMNVVGKMRQYNQSFSDECVYVGHACVERCVCYSLRINRERWRGEKRLLILFVCMYCTRHAHLSIYLKSVVKETYHAGHLDPLLPL